MVYKLYLFRGRKILSTTLSGFLAIGAMTAPVILPVGVTSLVVTQTNCGGTSTLQSVLNGTGPLLKFAVSKGRISQPTADKLTQDFKDAGKCAADLEDALDQISKDDPQAKQKKRNAWLTAANFCWKPIVLRQNFAADPQIQRVSAIIDGIFTAGVGFFAEPPPGVAAAPVKKDEKDLEKDIKCRLEELKEAMKTEK